MTENPQLANVNTVDPEGCEACADAGEWPCAYHEGFADGVEAMRRITIAAAHDPERWVQEVGGGRHTSACASHRDRPCDCPERTNLVYAAVHRCPCHAGLAYRRGDDAWDCAAILLGTADDSVRHTPLLPFVFYEIKSENQPSARGASTRPVPPS